MHFKLWLMDAHISPNQLQANKKKVKNSIRDARTPQNGEIVFNTMTYRSSETVQRLGYFQHSVTYIKVQD